MANRPRPGPQDVHLGASAPDQGTHVRSLAMQPSVAGQHDYRTASGKVYRHDPTQQPAVGQNAPEVINRDPSLLERADYVRKAATLAGSRYALTAIKEQVGNDAMAILTGIIEGLLAALAVVAVGAVGGAIIGGLIAGILSGGAAAPVGAAGGAEIGIDLATGLLSWLGLAFLVVYLSKNIGAMASQFGEGISKAWHSGGERSRIDLAARQLAAGIGLFVSLMLQAIVAYLLDMARKQNAGEALAKLRKSVLFRFCPKLEPWLKESMWKIRVKMSPAPKYEVLSEGPAISPNSSVPTSMRLKVDGRVWEISARNAAKLDKNGKPIGHTLKHLVDRVNDGPKSDLPGIGTDPKVPSPWMNNAGLDFPIAALAGALSRAECELVFQESPNSGTMLRFDGWEIIVDTTQKEWRVYHIIYLKR